MVAVHMSAYNCVLQKMIKKRFLKKCIQMIKITFFMKKLRILPAES